MENLKLFILVELHHLWSENTLNNFWISKHTIMVLLNWNHEVELVTAKIIEDLILENLKYYQNKGQKKNSKRIHWKGAR